MNLPNELKYAKSHEWARREDDGRITVGISDHAQDQLGDVVFVELPEVGADFSAGDAIAVIESVKAASDIYAPVGGKVVAVNEALADSPELVNDGPYADGWLFVLEAGDAGELDALMDADGYAASVG